MYFNGRDIAGKMDKDLRKYLTGFGKTENETLTYLMGEKLQWMQSHGVTGYEKS